MTPAMKARFLWRTYKARYRDQAAELSAIRSHVSANDLVCDIGANKGSYLYWMSKWARRVVAFEPQPGLASYLETACQSLGLGNVKVEMAGVARQSGSGDLYVPAPNSPGASLHYMAAAKPMPVTVVALDDYFSPAEKIALMKIDVEGGELDVFRGAERILRQHRPVLLFECERRHMTEGSVATCISYLEDLGYRGEFFDHGAILPVSAFDPARHQNESGAEFWKSKDYCNNFIFAPAR